MKHLDLTVLREKHPRFFYKKVETSFADGTLELTFTFELQGGPTFHPKLQFKNLSSELVSRLPTRLIQEWAFQIGLVEMMSYWKAAVSPQIIIEAGYLNSEQLPFWMNLLHKGLSEFFFVNKVNGWQDGFVQCVVTAPKIPYEKQPVALSEKALIPVGGGKDSVVSLELAKKLPFDFAALTLNLNPQVAGVLDEVGEVENIQVVRKMDEQLLQLNEVGYLNGHTPFSALLAFVGTFAAALYDMKYVALSNEWSANEGNTVFLGQTINHQYSKTFEFELSFRQYLHTYLCEEVQYFSWLRPLHELQIAKIFARFPNYFSLFLSCNRGQKSGKWCGECPKCLFVYIMLSAFLSPRDVQRIWGQDLMMKMSLKPILEELTGESEVKSFECVGTRQESIYALALTLEAHPELKEQGLWKDASFIVENAQHTAAQARSFLLGYENDTLIPPEFKAVLANEMKANNV